jgi:hypothetical protein
MAFILRFPNKINNRSRISYYHDIIYNVKHFILAFMQKLDPIGPGLDSGSELWTQVGLCGNLVSDWGRVKTDSEFYCMNRFGVQHQCVDTYVAGASSRSILSTAK